MNDIKLYNRYDVLKYYNNISSMNECKIFNECNKKIIFPYIKNYDILKIDKKSLYYISTYKIANRITNVVNAMIKKIGLKSNNVKIVDCCAGVGGNTISFAQHFKHISAVEIDKLRCQYLENNINAYKLNVNVHHGDYTKIYDKINSDVVFIDPPWGGRNYKKHDKLKLYISNINMADLCNELLKNNKLIVMKIPYNFDFKDFNNIVKCRQRIYKFNKMIILCIFK